MISWSPLSRGCWAWEKRRRQPRSIKRKLWESAKNGNWVIRIFSFKTTLTMKMSSSWRHIKAWWKIWTRDAYNWPVPMKNCELPPTITRKYPWDSNKAKRRQLNSEKISRTDKKGSTSCRPKKKLTSIWSKAMRRWRRKKMTTFWSYRRKAKNPSCWPPNSSKVNWEWQSWSNNLLKLENHVWRPRRERTACRPFEGRTVVSVTTSNKKSTNAKDYNSKYAIFRTNFQTSRENI